MKGMCVYAEGGEVYFGEKGKPEMGWLCGVGCRNPFCALVEALFGSSEVCEGAIHEARYLPPYPQTPQTVLCF